MQLPNEQQCQNYFKEYVVPQNIVKHCQKVQEVANFLAIRLERSGVEINKEFVSRLSLMHDMFKMVSLKDLKPNKFHQQTFTEEEIEMWKQLREKYPGMYEGDVANLIFNEEFPKLALSLKNYNNRLIENPSWEELVVHYADCRVFHDEIVNLSERLDYLKEHYPGRDQWWEERWMKIKKIEDKIMLTIKNLQPEELKIKITGDKNNE